jgi:hypothetical protein
MAGVDLLEECLAGFRAGASPCAADPRLAEALLPRLGQALMEGEGQELCEFVLQGVDWRAHPQALLPCL